MALNADILAGNHEERFPQADDPAFAGYNWELLRWTREQMEGLPLTWPRTLQIGDMLFAHGTPENPNELLEAEEVPALLARLPEGVRWYFSGHNHNAWNVCAHGCRAVNPGSLGLMEDDLGGRAPFAVGWKRNPCNADDGALWFGRSETRLCDGRCGGGCAGDVPHCIVHHGDGRLSGGAEICAAGKAVGRKAGHFAGRPAGVPHGGGGVGLGRRPFLRGILETGGERDMNDTIAALATAPGEGGIAIVRLSGPDSEQILSRVFRPAGKQFLLTSHMLTYGHLLDEAGERIDECMAVIMRAPRSYTREDVVELQLHGGVYVARKALALCFAAGARPAEACL